jgi:hypothetical protein
MENTPKGKLIAIGGAEDKGNEQEKPGSDPAPSLRTASCAAWWTRWEDLPARIALITTASSIPKEVGRTTSRPSENWA